MWDVSGRVGESCTDKQQRLPSEWLTDLPWFAKCFGDRVYSSVLPLLAFSVHQSFFWHSWQTTRIAQNLNMATTKKMKKGAQLLNIQWLTLTFIMRSIMKVYQRRVFFGRDVRGQINIWLTSENGAWWLDGRADGIFLTVCQTESIETFWTANNRKLVS